MGNDGEKEAILVPSTISSGKLGKHFTDWSRASSTCRSERIENIWGFQCYRDSQQCESIPYSIGDHMDDRKPSIY